MHPFSGGRKRCTGNEWVNSAPATTFQSMLALVFSMKLCKIKIK